MSQDQAGSSSKISVLRKHPIYSDLEPEALDQLCRYAKHTSLKRGATIFCKGDPGESVFGVISGTVKISVSSAEGRSAILNLIGAGDTFGEIAVLSGQGRTADATANTNCEIFVIDRRDFLPFVRSQPALAMKFIELLCARLRRTSDAWMMSNTRRSVAHSSGSRFAWCSLFNADEHVARQQAVSDLRKLARFGYR